jgi:hypothetical protein
MLFPGMALTAPLTVLCGQVGRSVPVETGKIVNGCSGTSLTDLGLARAWNQPCSAPSTPKSVNDVSERVLTMYPVSTGTDRPVVLGASLKLASARAESATAEFASRLHDKLRWQLPPEFR